MSIFDECKHSVSAFDCNICTENVKKAPEIEAIIRSAYYEGRKEQMEKDAKIARKTIYNRFCDPHEAGLRTTHHGCAEIAAAIRQAFNQESKERG